MGLHVLWGVVCLLRSSYVTTLTQRDIESRQLLVGVVYRSSYVATLRERERESRRLLAGAVYRSSYVATLNEDWRERERGETKRETERDTHTHTHTQRDAETDKKSSRLEKSIVSDELKYHTSYDYSKKVDTVSYHQVSQQARLVKYYIPLQPRFILSCMEGY